MDVSPDAATRFVEGALQFMGRDYPEEASAAFQESFTREVSSLQLTNAAGKQCWVRDIHINCGHFPTPWPINLRETQQEPSEDKPEQIAFRIDDRDPIGSGGGPTYCIPIIGTGCELCFEWYCEST